MRIFRRLISYSLRYKYRFLAGVVCALFTAILNAISLTALIPLFDSLDSSKKEGFKFEFTIPEKNILLKERFFGEDSLDGLERIKRLIIDFKQSVNSLTKDKTSKEVVWLVCKFVMPMYLLKLITYLLSVYYIATTGYTAVRDLRQELFDKMQNLSLNLFYKEKSGILMSRIINDVEIIAAVISSNLRDAIINFFYVITHLTILLYLNTELLVIAIFTVPILVYPVTLFTNKILKSTTKFQERMANLNGHIQEILSGMKEIRIFNAESFELARFTDINEKATWRNFKGQFYLQIAPALVEFTSSLVVLGFFSIGAKFIATQQFTQGEFMTFLLTLLFLLRPLTQLSQMIGKISQSIAAGERIFEIIDRDGEAGEKVSYTPYKAKIRTLKDSIEFQDIYFQYTESKTEVLKSINLKINIGDTVAFVGQSGSGKSTLMDLIPMFYIPTKGKILFDNVDISTYSLADVRKKIGIVTQDIFLFHGTVAENIAYGMPGCLREEIIYAATLANAHEFIMEMEHGYDSLLGIRGLNLSGGQRQRLVIARALLRDPEILILDEATSALDAQSEKLVSDALHRLFEGRTMFIIAHRLSTIRSVKKIVVLHDGEVVEQGDHESLLAQNGIYTKLYENQFVVNGN
ncbi:MAG: ABC transporter ATP-binding protein [Leptospiraceae bacterium]|nr:ABC transporter ATP-binding protein [Leptospiraceae bacterium]MCP5496186.1 ABC transporter ATP-binding protein [Leptospiraceae bacterium]